ncbi:uncharacterized protein LOC142915369 [Petromyzon marinus]|uniref:uncharacterized protein LOC142915369 n=1 Tax=Petromyzon marinus TaxID=7757 RepID=UPI003F71A39C
MAATRTFRNYRSLNVEGERFQIFENGTLHIVDLRREDSDTYTCFATNNLNTGQLRAHLSVEGTREGGGLDRLTTLTMQMAVVSPMRFRNYRSLNVEGERFQIFENGTLHIVDLRREDSDTYTCFATNNLNTGQLRAHLSVEVAPGGEEEDEDEDGEDEEEDEEEDEDKEDEEEDEEEEDEEEGQDDGKEASTSSPSAPNAGSGRDGGADEGEDDDDELLATSIATTSSATTSAAVTSAVTTSAATTSAGRASATSKASCCPGAAWPTALLLTLVQSWRCGGDV